MRTLPDDPDTLKGMIRGLLAMLRIRDLELSGVRQWLDQLSLGLYGPQGEHLRPDQPPSTTLRERQTGNCCAGWECQIPSSHIPLASNLAYPISSRSRSPEGILNAPCTRFEQTIL